MWQAGVNAAHQRAPKAGQHDADADASAELFRAASSYIRTTFVQGCATSCARRNSPSGSPF